MDLTALVLKQQIECLNESDHHTIVETLHKGPEYLESDCDEQVKYLF